jgi:hypothetical protein
MLEDPIQLGGSTLSEGTRHTAELGDIMVRHLKRIFSLHIDVILGSMRGAHILNDQADDLVGQVKDVVDWASSTLLGSTGLFAGRHLM